MEVYTDWAGLCAQWCPELASHVTQSCDLSALPSVPTLQFTLLLFGVASISRLGSSGVYWGTSRSSFWLASGEHDPGIQIKSDKRNGLEMNKENVCMKGGVSYVLVALLPIGVG